MRSLWSGSLSFGLVSIPIKLYSASKERALKFKLLSKHGSCPISYMKVCRGDNKEVPYDEIVKGYEYQKDDYVILTDEDFKKVSPKKTQTIDIQIFCDESDIDPTYYDASYFIEPDKRSEKAYVLLREAMKRSKKVAIAKFVLKQKEHIAAIKPEGHALILHQLRFADEVRTSASLAIPDKADYSAKELEVALSLLAQLEEHFDAHKYHDTYTEDIEKIIELKKKGKKIVVAKGEQPAKGSQMEDLMQLLKKSLEKEKSKAHAAPLKTAKSKS